MTIGHDDFLRCRDHILAAFSKAAESRSHTDLDWIENERLAVTMAANSWAVAHGCPTVTVADIEKVEQLAVGHFDYASKFSLYVAELVTGRGP